MLNVCRRFKLVANKKIVFGAYDSKRGYLQLEKCATPKTEVVGGLLAEESAVLLKTFFKKKDRGCFGKEYLKKSPKF